MVLISSKKYACETCIKGHRSSVCKHTDRPLFEIKKKGRPVTQCEHCRELRKTKQVHVKCICESKEEPSGRPQGSSKKGATVIPESAAFPHGLPEATEASVALPNMSEDPNHRGDPHHCTCLVGGECHCWVPRKSIPRVRKKDGSDSQSTDGHNIVPVTTTLPTPSSSKNLHSHIHTSRTPSHILARIAELRPVLPRPTSKDRLTIGPTHNPSSGTAHEHGRHTHENMHFSPYGRAYDFMHDYTYDQSPGQGAQHQDTSVRSPTPTFSIDERSYPDQFQMLESNASVSWQSAGPQFDTPAATSFPSTCGCGENCRCAGCIDPNTRNHMPSSTFLSCATPGACANCLDCMSMSLPSALPPDTSLSIYDNYQAQAIDEWIRQVSELPPISPIPSPSNGSEPSQEQQHPHNPWSAFDLSQISEPLDIEQSLVESQRGASACLYPHGFCECETQDHGRVYDPGRGMPERTFFTPGQQASCTDRSCIHSDHSLPQVFDREDRHPSPDSNIGSKSSSLYLAPTDGGQRRLSFQSIDGPEFTNCLRSPSSPSAMTFFQEQRMHSSNVELRPNVSLQTLSSSLSLPEVPRGVMYATSNTGSDGSTDYSHSYSHPHSPF